MRKSNLLLFVLSVLVCLSVVSSVTCFARDDIEYEEWYDETERVFLSAIPDPSVPPVSTYSIRDDSLSSGSIYFSDSLYEYDGLNKKYFISDTVGNTLSDVVEYQDAYRHQIMPLYYDNTNFKFIRNFRLRISNENLLDIGQGLDISINGILHKLAIYNAAGQHVKNIFGDISKCDLWYNIYYTDGTHITVSDDTGKVSFSGDTLSNGISQLNLTVDCVEKPVAYIDVMMDFNLLDMFPGFVAAYGNDEVYSLYYKLNYYSFSTSLTLQNKETGLLNGLLQWVKSIWESVIQIPDKINSVITTISELPSKIWSFISEGLKSLFVPNSEKIEEFKTNFDNLFAERFGALYESGAYITNFFKSLHQNGSQTTIQIPECTVNLVGVAFTFGGYTVQIVPERFKFLLDILKSLIDIVVTVAFINAMKKRFEGILGSEESAD